MDSTLPGCFSLGNPLPPNKCRSCPFRVDCRKFARREKVEEVLAKVGELKQTLQGE